LNGDLRNGLIHSDTLDVDCYFSVGCALVFGSGTRVSFLFMAASRRHRIGKGPLDVGLPLPDTCQCPVG
jgi:hypothetical protein